MGFPIWCVRACVPACAWTVGVMQVDRANIQPDKASLRPKLWKLMLGVEDLGVVDYLTYVSRGPSAVSSKSKLRFAVNPPSHQIRALTGQSRMTLSGHSLRTSSSRARSTRRC
jgi:hypothetical protein